MDSISVIIPARNAELYLGEAIASVRAQTHHVLEIIVVDNNSEDGTAALARELNTIVITEPTRGASSARNRGVSEAKGRFLAFLDADDVWISEKLESQMEAFRTDPFLEAAFGLIEQFISGDIAQEEASRLHVSLEASAARLPSTMLIKKESFHRIGPYSTEWKRAEVLEWNVRAMEMGLRQFSIPRVVARRRLHASNTGVTMREYNLEYLRIIRMKMLREKQRMTSENISKPLE
jgi:glycosyltransferase involved in cell wall biosynthesis